jgi:hypothetical protein
MFWLIYVVFLDKMWIHLTYTINKYEQNHEEGGINIVTCQPIVGLRNRDYATERC